MQLHLPPHPEKVVTAAGSNTAPAASEPAVTNLVADPDRYPCTICAGHFNFPKDRADHMKDVHQVDEGWLCHECTSTFKEGGVYKRHVDEHLRNRAWRPAQPCFLSCKHKDSCPDALERHKQLDHVETTRSHQPQCPSCKYRNESMVAVSVHFLHTHSPEAVEKRKKALNEKRALKRAADRDAARAAHATAAESSAAAAPSPAALEQSKQHCFARPVASSSSATTTEKQASRFPATRTHMSYTDGFLAKQLAELEAMSPEQQKLTMGRHSDRKAASRKRKRAEACRVASS